MSATELHSYIGALPPGKSIPGFATPVYERGNELFLHEVDDEGRIMDFVPLYEQEHAVSLIAAPPDKTSYSIGDPALYVYVLPKQKILSGTRADVTVRLGKSLHTLRNYPFARLDAAEFVGNKKKVVQAAVESESQLKKLNPETARFWKKSIWQEFGVHSQELESEQLNQFCIALVSLYRKYHDLLHASSLGKRQALEKQYSKSYVRIFGFLMDTDFEVMLDRELSNIDQGVSQLSFSFDDSSLSKLTHVLMQLGAKGSEVARFIARHFSVPVDTHLRSPARAQAICRNLLNLDTTLSHELSIARVMEKADKKLRKRELEEGTASVAFGLVMVIHGQTMSASSPIELGRKMRIYGALAVDHGLRNLRPPRESIQVEEAVRAFTGRASLLQMSS